MKALIAGGGIGGLVSALCLHEIGIDVRVFESVREIRPLGVRINLLPHAVRVLANLGLLPLLERAAIPTAELIYFNKFGQQICASLGTVPPGYAWPQLSIHRGRFQAILLDEVRRRFGSDSVHTGCHLAEFTECGDRVHARFIARKYGETGVSEVGDVLVGADGIHSAARARFYPNEGPPATPARCFGARRPKPRPT